MATAPHYEARTVYGPFKRLASPTQTPDVMGAILRSGELWGRPPRRWSARPLVQAYRRALEPEEEGFEFYTWTPPDRPWGPEMTWSARDDDSVREEGGVARVNVLITRVQQAIE